MTSNTPEKLVVGTSIVPKDQVMEGLECRFGTQDYRSIFVGQRLFLSSEIYHAYLVPLEHRKVLLGEQILLMATYLSAVQRALARCGPRTIVTTNGWLLQSDKSEVQVHLRFEPILCREGEAIETEGFLVDEVSGGQHEQH